MVLVLFFAGDAGAPRSLVSRPARAPFSRATPVVRQATWLLLWPRVSGSVLGSSIGSGSPAADPMRRSLRTRAVPRCRPALSWSVRSRRLRLLFLNPASLSPFPWVPSGSAVRAGAAPLPVFVLCSIFLWRCVCSCCCGAAWRHCFFKMWWLRSPWRLPPRRVDYVFKWEVVWFRVSSSGSRRRWRGGWKTPERSCFPGAGAAK